MLGVRLYRYGIRMYCVHAQCTCLFVWLVAVCFDRQSTGLVVEMFGLAAAGSYRGSIGSPFSLYLVSLFMVCPYN